MSDTMPSRLRAARNLIGLARPGVLSRVPLPLGEAVITNGMPLLRALALDEDAASPDDVPPEVMPKWTVSLVCAIGDNLAEPEYIQFARDLGAVMPQADGHDAVWSNVQLSFVCKMVKDAVAVVSPFSAQVPTVSRNNQRLLEIIERAQTNRVGAVKLFADHAGIHPCDLGDDPEIEGKVYHLVDGQRSTITSVEDILLLPDRLAVFGAGLLAGHDRRARQMVLDFDWEAFLVSQYIKMRRDILPGMDWAGLSQWLVNALKNALSGHDESGGERRNAA